MREPTRHHPRYEVETEVLYTPEASPSAQPPQKAKGVCARNLSQGGLLLEAQERLSPGTRLALLVIRGKRGAIEAQGEVVWTDDTAARPVFRHGIRIIKMEPSQDVAWKSFLDEASRELGRRSLRFDIDVPITCRRTDTGDSLGGRAIAVNVSRGGFLVLLSVRVPVDTVLCLEVRTPTQSLKTEARVVRFEEPGPDGLIPHGMAFVDSHEGSRLLPELFLVGIL
jgi:PilZ domain-containing protein